MAIKVDGVDVAGRGAPGLSAYRSAQLGGYTGTEEEFYAALGNSGSAGGLQMVLLWENASPTSAFAAQTVSLDLSGYEAVFIVATAKFTPGDGVATTGEAGWLGFVGKVLILQTIEVSSDATYRTQLYLRTATVNSDGIVFGDAVQGTTGTFSATDSKVIPLRIYGMKGVTTNE